MKHTQSYFYGSGHSLVRISDRLYQPVDVSTLLKKPVLAEPLADNLKLLLKFVTFSIAGFLMGGVLAELVANDILSSLEFNFLYVVRPFFEALSFSTFLSGIISAGIVGAMIGVIVAGLSLINVPE